MATSTSQELTNMMKARLLLKLSLYYVVGFFIGVIAAPKDAAKFMMKMLLAPFRFIGSLLVAPVVGMYSELRFSKENVLIQSPKLLCKLADGVVAWTSFIFALAVIGVVNLKKTS